MGNNPTAYAVVTVLVALLTACGGGGGGSSTAVVVEPDPIPPGELNIRGTISVSPAVAVDRDTNDPNAPASNAPDNDFPVDYPGTQATEGAQLIPNPGSVGGFVSFARNSTPEDLHDFYRVSLVPGQTLSLVIADHIADKPFAQDLDLLLVDLQGALIDFAAGLGPVESLTIAEAGEYFVLVTACADPLFDSPIGICGQGGSNYLLNVGQPSAGPEPASLRLTADFAVGEALVRYAADELEAGATPDAEPAFVASSLAAPSRKIGDVELISFAVPKIITGVASALDSGGGDDGGFKLKLSADQLAKAQTLVRIKQLQAEQNVAWAEPNYMRHALFVPDDPGYEYQWHFPLINLPAAWDQGYFGSGVTVAVIDTGILPFHPDIEGQITGGYDFISDLDNARDGDGPDDDPTDPGDSTFFGFSSSFHGTHVAGTVAAATNNATGVAGVAPDARLLPLRVLGPFGGRTSDIAQALCFAADLGSEDICDGVPPNPRPADIINLSLGGSEGSDFEQDIIDAIVDAGVIVVAAAGNASSSRKFYPAAYDGVFAVSAVGPDQTLAPYSSFGDFIDVAAPGGDATRDLNGDGFIDGVLSAGGDDSRGSVEYVYPFLQGTSMAAPHVAGVFALMRAVNQGLTSSAIESLLQAGELTIPLDQEPGVRNDSFGYGLIDAQKAVLAALADPNPSPPQPWLGVFPRALNFGATLDALNIVLRNNAGGDLNILSMATVDSAPWLTVPPVDGLGEYTLEVDRRSLEEGSYSTVLRVTSDENTVDVPIIMQKSNALLSGDAGHLYVRLIDPETGEIREVQTDAVNGQYSWQIDGLPPRKYQLVAFTDADADRQVCDAGEACGSYLTVDQPIQFELDADRADLDFQVSFGVALSDPDDSDKTE